MINATQFPSINQSKANFTGIYDEEDPRSYFRVLGGLDYVLPGLAAPLFKQLIKARAGRQDQPVTVLDLGCSYGINGALLRFPLKLEMLRRRYMLPEVQALSPGAMKLLDTAYYASWPTSRNIRVIGLDTSAKAVRYAEGVGLLHDGLAEDFEAGDPSVRARLALENVDIVISTGCIGYTTARTIQRIISCNRNRELPWVASFVLRMFPYQDIAGSLAADGLATEKLDGATFVQRRFHDAAEYEATLSKLEALGIDPEGHESEGLLLAELFVSRPGKLVQARPLHSLVSVVSGKHQSFGRRFVSVPGQGHRQLLLN